MEGIVGDLLLMSMAAVAETVASGVARPRAFSVFVNEGGAIWSYEFHVLASRIDEGDAVGFLLPSEVLGAPEGRPLRVNRVFHSALD